MTVTNEQMVCDYFRLIDVKELEGLRLFAENAIVVGPFCRGGRFNRQTCNSGFSTDHNYR